ncbi:MAG: ArnT family glycosyltransferase [Chthoniobacterales bacterium]
MTKSEPVLAGWLGLLCLALAAVVYLHNTGSEYAATNPDEYLYLQIARLTAQTGQWLPLQAAKTEHRNTKPPGLFWQGMAATGFGENWELWRLRLPNALFSLATAAMAFVLGRRMTGASSAGVIAAAAYLAFLGVYRHGRVFLTSAPETFWLFLPFFVLILRRREGIGWGTALGFGLMLGTGLLYKSFAMIIPSAGALAWYTLHQGGYRPLIWLRHDAPKIAVLASVALAVFALWFLLDPQGHFILQDFVLKENAGKFDADETGYLANALWGKHSIWAYSLGWLTNAGLVAPAVLAVFVLGWRDRRTMSPSEQILWIWIITLFLFHLLPNIRYERYLLPAMPAVAVLCGLYWPRIPRWILAITLAACVVLGFALLAGAALLTGNLTGAVSPYRVMDWILLSLGPVVAAFALFGKSWIRALTLPAVLLLYLGFTAFLPPFDGPLGMFPATASEAVHGKMVIVPSPFTARDEIYRFLLPGADVRRIKSKDLEKTLGAPDADLFIVPVSLTAPATLTGFRVVGTRLKLNDYFTAEETREMLRGRVASHLFGRELLVTREAGASSGPPER